MTDIAPAMVARTRSRFAGRSEVDVAIMDGEQPFGDPFDLICSTLAAQWFADLPAAIKRLCSRLTPDGRLAFTTLASGSFAEWRAAHGNLPSGVHDYPSPQALAGLDLDVTIEQHRLEHADARTFLRAVKAIGAGRPRPGHRPLTPAQLRGVMARFEEAGAVATYVVATCVTGPAA